MAIRSLADNHFICTVAEIKSAEIIVADYTQSAAGSIKTLRTQEFSYSGKPEWKKFVNFCLFFDMEKEKKWIRELDENLCPFIYQASKGAIYCTIEDMMYGTPYNYYTEL